MNQRITMQLCASVGLIIISNPNQMIVFHSYGNSFTANIQLLNQIFTVIRQQSRLSISLFFLTNRAIYTLRETIMFFFLSLSKACNTLLFHHSTSLLCVRRYPACLPPKYVCTIWTTKDWLNKDFLKVCRNLHNMKKLPNPAPRDLQESLHI